MPRLNLYSTCIKFVFSNKFVYLMESEYLSRISYKWQHHCIAIALAGLRLYWISTFCAVRQELKKANHTLEKLISACEFIFLYENTWHKSFAHKPNDWPSGLVGSHWKLARCVRYCLPVCIFPQWWFFTDWARWTGIEKTAQGRKQKSVMVLIDEYANLVPPSLRCLSATHLHFEMPNNDTKSQ